MELSFFILIAVIVFVALAKTKNGGVIIGIIFVLFLISFVWFCSDFEREEEERKERLDKAVDEIRKNKERYKKNAPKMCIPSQWLYRL